MVASDATEPALSLPLRKAFATRADWRVTAYQAPGDEGRLGDIPARICFNRGAAGEPENCTKLMRAATNDSERLVYQTVTGLSVTRLQRADPPVNAVLAQADMSYGAGASSTQYALWGYAARGDTFRPLATFQLSDQGELQIFDSGALAGMVITAEFVLGAGETHYGRHRFSISVHQLNPLTMTYTELLRYVTRGKYRSLDEGGVDVVRPEQAETLRILKYLYPDRF
jgi:hypothetical protein